MATLDKVSANSASSSAAYWQVGRSLLRSPSAAATSSLRLLLERQG